MQITDKKLAPEIIIHTIRNIEARERRYKGKEISFNEIIENIDYFINERKIIAIPYSERLLKLYDENLRR